MRWACDREMAKMAASSRNVRFVRSAAQAITRRRWSDCAHGRPRDRLRDPNPRQRASIVSCELVKLVRLASSWPLLDRRIAYWTSEPCIRIFRVASTGERARTRGPNKKTPWVRRAEDGLSVLRLPLDTRDPVQRARLEAMFSAAYSVRRAVQRDARDRTRAYWGAQHERARDPAAVRERLGLSKKRFEYAAYGHVDAAPHLRQYVTKALAMHLADSVWSATERHLFRDRAGARHGMPGVTGWYDFTRLPGRARSHTKERTWETFRLHGSLAGHRAAYTGDDGRFMQPRRMRQIAEPATSWWDYAGPLAVVFSGLPRRHARRAAASAGVAVEPADPRSSPRGSRALAQDRCGSPTRSERRGWLALRGAPDGAGRAVCRAGRRCTPRACRRNDRLLGAPASTSTSPTSRSRRTRAVAICRSRGSSATARPRRAGSSRPGASGAGSAPSSARVARPMRRSTSCPSARRSAPAAARPRACHRSTSFRPAPAAHAAMASRCRRIATTSCRARTAISARPRLPTPHRPRRHAAIMHVRSPRRSSPSTAASSSSRTPTCVAGPGRGAARSRPSRPVCWSPRSSARPRPSLAIAGIVGGVVRASTRTTALSQHCVCGARVAKSLGDRVHDCVACGLRGDRDAVAATLAACVRVEPNKPASAAIDHSLTVALLYDLRTRTVLLDTLPISVKGRQDVPSESNVHSARDGSFVAEKGPTSHRYAVGWLGEPLVRRRVQPRMSLARYQTTSERMRMRTNLTRDCAETSTQLRDSSVVPDDGAARAAIGLRIRPTTIRRDRSSIPTWVRRHCVEMKNMVDRRRARRRAPPPHG